MKKDTIVVILAGGIGKRFSPFVTDKSLFPFFGESIIVTNLKKFTHAGFTHFVIVTNEGNDPMIKAISLPNVHIKTVIQKEPKGMADAILTISNMLTGSPMLVVNAEDVVDNSLYEDLYVSVRKKEPFVVGRKVSEYFDGGYLEISRDRLLRVIEKPGKGREPSNFINLVFHYFPYADTFITNLSRVKSIRDDVYEEALNLFCKEFAVTVVPYSGNWSPLKYPWHVLPMMQQFLRTRLVPSRGKRIDIRNNVILEGPIAIGNNVKIFENTKIVGPTFIGDDTIIGSNNIIRESMIGHDSVTGFNTDIARSYIGNTCWFHNNYIGDSVLEGNVSMGSGSVLANFRLDEGIIRESNRTKLGTLIARDVRIGVNTSIMPGIKIGANTLIGAGIVLDQDIPANSFCVGKTAYEIKSNSWKVAQNREELKKIL